MPSLTIDLTVEEHERLAAMAAARGQTLRELVLTATLNDGGGASQRGEAEALAALTSALQPRIEAGRTGSRSTLSIAEIAASERAAFDRR